MREIAFANICTIILFAYCGDNIFGDGQTYLVEIHRGSRKSINLFLKYCGFLNMMIAMIMTITMITMITMPMMTNISTTSAPSAFADGSHAGFSQWSSQLYLLWKPLPSLFTFLLDSAAVLFQMTRKHSQRFFNDFGCCKYCWYIKVMWLAT